MHEASIVADIVDGVLAELDRYDVTKVNAVNMVVGDLTQLGSEQMQFAYEVLTRGTILEGSVLNIEAEPVELRCRGCGYEGPAEMADFGDGPHGGIPVLACPKCGGQVDVVKGNSCAVRTMDIETREDRRWLSSTGTRRPRRR